MVITNGVAFRSGERAVGDLDPAVHDRDELVLAVDARVVDREEPVDIGLDNPPIGGVAHGDFGCGFDPLDRVDLGECFDRCGVAGELDHVPIAEVFTHHDLHTRLGVDGFERCLDAF